MKSDGGDSRGRNPTILGAEVWHIIDSVPAFVWCAGPDGSIEFLNQRGLAYTGFSLGEIRGWNWKETNILHPDDTHGLFEEWSAIVASGQEGEIQARMKRFDGEYEWFLFRVAPLKDHSGRLIGWLGIDVEIEKRTELLVSRAVRRRQAALRPDKQQPMILLYRPDGFLAGKTSAVREPLRSI